MKLRGILAPGTGLHHQIRRFLRLPGNLAEDGFVSAQCRIAQEEFDEKGLRLAGFGIMGGEGMPPPVLAFRCLGTEKLAGITVDIVFIE